MSGPRGIPVQDVYPDWFQLRPVQERLEETVEAPKEKPARRARKAAEETPVSEAPASEDAE